MDRGQARGLTRAGQQYRAALGCRHRIHRLWRGVLTVIGAQRAKFRCKFGTFTAGQLIANYGLGP